MENKNQKPEFEGKIALVTGASRGIGRALSIDLAKKGATIIAVARPKSKGALEELDDEIIKIGGKAVLVPLDLTKHDDIDTLGGVLYERFGKLDILAGFAGQMGPITPVGHLDPKAYNALLAINLTANWRLIRSMEPLLRKSDTPRALFLTSHTHKIHQPFHSAYNMTKAALESLIITWANEVKTSKIKANLADPGPVATRLRRDAHPGEDQSLLSAPSDVSPFLLSLLASTVQTTGQLHIFKEWDQKAKP